MSEVTVHINGLRYRLTCEDGEQQRIAQLAEHIDAHVKSLKKGIGSVGNDRLLVMVALTIADELWEAKASLSDMQSKLDLANSPEIITQLQSIASRIETLQERLDAFDPDQPYDDDMDYYQEA